ncbi:MAG: serine/threonine protein kinase [Candidatus Obscuribacterales bacterium]|nr:serine/threonine protein kinase [Candidatus Obscuribacterales bacterium]
MAELQLKLSYRTAWSRVLFVLMCALFPVWSIVGPASLGILLVRTIRAPETVPLEMAVFVSLALLIFTLLCICLTALAEVDKINVSKDGMAFPPMFLPKLKFRRNRPWNELKTADILNSNKTLLLGFDDGSLLPVQTSVLKAKDLEQFFLALQLWGINCQSSPQLEAFQKLTQNNNKNEAASGYTQMWEDELRHRFSSTTFMPLEPEHRLRNGSLKVVRQLAFGGLSAIYLAQQNSLDLVVLKEAVVPPGAKEEAKVQAERMLDREAQMLSRLQHPNIARVFDHFVEDQRHYLILEYINGPDLRQFIKQNGVLPEEKALDWAMKIAGVLCYMHSQEPPIIHRDLTPDNIVLSKEDLFIIDFGAANQFVGASTGTIVGKQAYIPPEQLRGKSSVLSDIYAFGGTIYYLLCGTDPKALAPSSPRSLRPEISEELDSIIAKCTAFEAEDRFQSVAELLEALQNCRSRVLTIDSQVIHSKERA